MNRTHKFSDKNIIVIGDIILDKFVYGKSYRKSPEHPVDVIKIHETKYYLGGAANVAANIIGLGAQVKLLSVIGDDDNAKRLLRMLDEINCSSRDVIIDKSRPSTLKSRVFSNEKAVCRIDEESEANLSAELEDIVLDRLAKIINDEETSHGIILQDYNKGCLSKDLIRRIMELAIINQIPVFVDPKFNNLKAFKGATIIKPNYAEISAFLGYEPELNLNGLDAAAEKLKNYVDHDILIITLSEKGAYFRRGSSGKIIQTNPILNPDVCGAGDSFISAISLAYVSDYKPEACIDFANKCSAIVCERSGIYAVKLEDL